MGYALYIKRLEDELSISANEWHSLVDSDPSLRMIGRIEWTNPLGEVITYTNPHLAEWSDGDRSVPFDFRSGRVAVKPLDGKVLAKMLELAEKLSAQVVGDDGEFYTRDETHGIDIT
ncbi:MAG: hypothetical protein AAGF95_30310 [Chloroflexota bacterium]